MLIYAVPRLFPVLIVLNGLLTMAIAASLLRREP